ncbi:MAG: YqaJ viral recombinase family protein [Tidjanibacter sp.]|nr:YqaJ viral recombinase family protein [Tidjanibacter sp.]
MEPLSVFFVVGNDRSDFIKKGKDLEDLIRVKYCAPYFQNLGYVLYKPNCIFVSRTCRYLRANLDAFAVPEHFEKDYAKNIVVEIKYVSEFGEQLWDGDEYNGVPVGYYAQVQHYMYVTGARKAVICALFDSTWEMRFYEIKYDTDFVALLLKETETFMGINVGLKIPPKINSVLDKEFIKDALNILEEEPIAITENPDMDEKIVQYKELKQNIKTLEQGANDLLSEITTEYLAGQRPTSPLCKVNITVVKNTVFDTKAFKEAHPELYKQFLKNTEYSRTTIK